MRNIKQYNIVLNDKILEENGKHPIFMKHLILIIYKFRRHNKCEI